MKKHIELTKYKKAFPWLFLVALMLASKLAGEHFISEPMHREKIPIFYLVILFFGGLVIIGGKKGLKSVVTLIITVLAVVKVLIPLILAGYDPMMVSICICIVNIVVALLLISGFNKKTLCAAIGTSAGVIIAGIAAFVVGNMIQLNGLSSDEAIHIMLYSKNIDFKGILFAGRIIGAMGAVMDVGMSIASSMSEIEQANPGMETMELINAGMNVGRDIMGTMADTLILAYVGSSLNIMLMFSTYEISFMEIISLDNIAAEIVRSLAGSIGLIFTVPITAAVAGFLRDKGIFQKEEKKTA